MPVLTFAYDVLAAELARGARRSVPDRATVAAELSAFGCSVESGALEGDMSLEILMNRPDLFCLEGVARAMRTFLGLAPPPSYTATPGSASLEVDPSVLDVRPEIASAVVRGVELDEAALARLLEAQEKLDLTYGRRRARVSVGLHDLSPLTSPIRYTAVAPDSVSFLPLHPETIPGGPRALTPGEILRLHPKGLEYAHLLAGKPLAPLLLDSKGVVLSMPPIINGTATELRPGRRDVFLDVTGTARETVRAAALLLSTQLAELGGSIQTVEVHRPGLPPCPEPDLSPTSRTLSVAAASRLLGMPLRPDEVARALERLGHHASLRPGGASLDVLSPCWRFDLLHEVDLIEDVAIGIGYRAVPRVLPRASTLAKESAGASLARRARCALTGLGFLEVATLTLTNPDEELSPLLGPAPAAAVVLNPISREHSVLRARLLPSLLCVLRANTRRDLPQAIFEIADVILHGTNAPRLAGALVGADASFTRVKGIAAALFEALGLPLFIESAHEPPYARGRCAAALCSGRPVGHFGELAPDVLSAFSLAHPACAFEFDLAALIASASSSAAR